MKKSVFSLCMVLCMILSTVCIPAVQATNLYTKGPVTFDNVDKVSAAETGFSSGTVIADPTYTIPGYESREGNKIYDPIPNSANEVVFNGNTGIIAISTQIFFDYYNGMDDPTSGYIANYYDNTDNYIGKMEYGESGKKYYNAEGSELSEADFKTYLSAYGSFLFRKTYIKNGNVKYYNNISKNSNELTEDAAIAKKAESGYYVNDEFTSEAGKLYGSDQSGSAVFNLRNSSTGINMFSITRNGNITSAHGGWGSTVFKKNKWYDVKFVVDTESSSMTGKYKLAEEETYKDIIWQCALEKADGTLYNGFTTKYMYDGNAVGNNKNGTLPANTSKLRLQGINDVFRDYVDNFEINTYKTVYESVNDCTTGAEVKAKLDLFASLGLFTGSSESLSYTDGLYDALVGRNFTSTSELQAFYNETVKEYTGIKFFGFEDEKTFTNNDASYYKKETDGTYSWGDSTDGGYTKMTGTGGVIVEDPTDSSNHVLSLGRSTKELRSDNGAKADIAQNFDTNILEFDVLVPEYNQTGTNGNIRFNTNYASSNPYARTWTDILRFSKGKAYIGTSRESAEVSIPQNTWHRIKMEIDSADDIIKYYFDGELKVSVKCSESAVEDVRNIPNEKSTMLNVMQYYGVANDYYIYLDNVKFVRYDNLCDKINNCASSSDVYNVLSKYSALGFFDFGDIIDSVIEKDAVYSELLHKGFTSNIAVQDAFDEAAWNQSVKESGGGGIIIASRNEESDGEHNYIKDVSLVINESGITDTSADFIAASYENGALYDIQTLNYTGSLERRQRIEWQGMNLDITKADSYKIFMFASGTVKPLAKSVSKDVELSVLTNFYPGWTKKAVTFTLDDANASADKKFIDVIKPAGMKGTFNLVTNNLNKDADTVRALYDGFEVANHTKYHPYPYYMFENETANYTPVLADDAFDENGNKLNLYKRKRGSYIAYDDEYIKCINAGHVEIERIFGEGSDTGLIWPGPAYGNRTAIYDYAKANYDMLRIAVTLNDPEFNLPADWLKWSFNADHTCSYSRAQAFDSLSLNDTDTLRWLCYGVHPSDYFSSEDGAANLTKAVDLLKNRSDTYWYAGNREIHDYTEALKKLDITKTSVTNNSELTLYIKVNGVKMTIAPGEKIGK